MTAPYKQIITVDLETYWDTKEGYTLSKMTTEEYIRDPRFKAFGACIHEFGSDKATQWHRGEELKRILGRYDPATTAVLAHNAQFDISILEWVYDWHPCFIFDTLSMARALRGVEVGNSLMKLAEDFGLPPKGTAVYTTNGYTELAPSMEQELAEYCAHDVYLCEQIFRRLVKGYPSSELRLIDMTLKMYTRPVLQLDALMLHNAIEQEKEKREALLQKLGVEETALASNAKFAALLEKLDVVPPTKVSKTTGKQALALAKNDALFQTLLNGEREDVALLCEARLRVKSTTERTRAQRFLDISQRGALPVPLSYYGAQTGRWTAAKGSAINMQNLKRGSFLRKAIMAPEGHQLVVGDLSQIEPRVLAWLSDYQDMLTIFRGGGDPYAAFGAQMFNVPGLTKESHPDLRQSAKSALLGCGYGLGWAAFASQLLVGFLGAPPVRYEKDFAKKLGVDGRYIDKFLEWDDNHTKMMEIPHTCTDLELLIHCVAAKKIIDKYRATAHPVVSFWDMCSGLIQTALADGNEFVYKCITFKKGEIVLPNGMSLLYPDLRQQKDEKGRSQWVYGPDATKLYAGKITNNVVQGTARIVMTDGMLRTAKRYFVAGTVHDEQIVVVPEAEVEEAKTWVLAQMVMEPSYMPGIPLDADGGAHRRYGLAKN
jgi:DNA polymerase I-like protein with 3'-5' exonuclease and polymerase domains